MRLQQMTGSLRQMTYALLYPPNWREVTYDIKEACGWQRTLTVAHLDHCYDGPATTVAALCAVCHLRYDASFVWHARRRHERIRRQLAGQLPLPLTPRK